MIIKAFNFTYFLLLSVTVGVAAVLTCATRNKSSDARRRLILGICLFNLLFYIVYKLGLYFRTPGLPADYIYISWKELPLHLCNISLFLVPIGLAKKSDSLMAYGVYIAPLGALLALTFPSVGFGDMSIFYPHMIGYYGTHAIIILNGILLVSMGLYRPTFKKIPAMFLFVFILSLITFGINLAIRHFTGISANYFYTVEPEGISILELFWSILPVPYLYITLGIVILAVYSVILTLPFHLTKKKTPV